jgi:hypothetical protein
MNVGNLVSMLMVFITVLLGDMFIYGWAGPQLCSEPDWSSMLLGIVLMVPIGFIFNLVTLHWLYLRGKRIFQGEVK